MLDGDLRSEIRGLNARKKAPAQGSGGSSILELLWSQAIALILGWVLMG